MKDLVSFWGFISGKRYSAVNTGRNDCEKSPRDPVAHVLGNRRLSRQGSVVLNQFFKEDRSKSSKRPRCIVYNLT
uniref:Uncharacterized protein n=1 Tax=Timema bartmani TaxID=61472 RepID=A0A7R9F0T0_9NEOP|nr:unnamed protein product [Timema bartmani]